MNDVKGFLHSNSHCIPSSAGFKISQTVRKAIVLAILCRKVHEIKKKLDPGGARVPSAPLDPPLASTS